MARDYIPYDKRKDVEMSDLVGLTFVSVTKSEGNSEIEFKTICGHTFLMHHEQDCCENVVIEDIVGDLADLVGEPILLAEAVTGESAQPSDWAPEYMPDSHTWTFYKLATRKGYVDIRWLGESNGYYSESVDLIEVLP
jgi:hypothetical protein